jgi:hypothetical protein
LSEKDRTKFLREAEVYMMTFAEMGLKAKENDPRNTFNFVGGEE